MRLDQLLPHKTSLNAARQQELDQHPIRTVHGAELSWGSDVPYGGEHCEYLPTPVVQGEKPLSLQQYQDTEVGPPGLGGGRRLILSSASFPKSVKGPRFLLGSTIPGWLLVCISEPGVKSKARRDCPLQTVH